jgi:curli production assembly/transport component CsgG
VDALVNQGRFKVVSRDQLERILRELKLSASGLVDPAAALKAGRLAAAEAVMVATVNESPRTAEIYAQLINTETSTVLASRDVFDPDKAPGSARAKMRELAARLKQEYPLVGGSVVTVSNQRVAVAMGSARRVRSDMKVIVYLEGDPLVDPQTKLVLDRNIEALGEGMLKDVRPQVSFAAVDGKDLGRIERMIAQKKLLKVITK